MCPSTHPGNDRKKVVFLHSPYPMSDVCNLRSTIMCISFHLCDSMGLPRALRVIYISSWGRERGRQCPVHCAEMVVPKRDLILPAPHPGVPSALWAASLRLHPPVLKHSGPLYSKGRKQLSTASSSAIYFQMVLPSFSLPVCAADPHASRPMLDNCWVNCFRS